MRLGPAVNAEGRVEVDRELCAALDLLDQLLLGAEDVAVVLGEAAGAQEAVDHAGSLVAVDRPQLGQPQWQLPVAARPGAVHQDVERAVHRLGVVGRGLVVLVEVHGRVHALGVEVEVPAGLPQQRPADVGAVDGLVAAAAHLRPDVVLHLLANDRALGVPDVQAGAQLLGEAEQVQLARELAVVALACLLQLLEVRRQRLAGLPRGPVDALQHRALLVPSPVRAGHALQRERRDPAGGGDVRSAAEVEPVAVLAALVGVERDLRGLGVGAGRVDARGLAVGEDLDLVGLVVQLLQRLVARELHAAEGLVLLDDLGHAGLDALEVLGRERLLDVEVVVEAVVDRRPDRELRAREEVGDRLRHHVGGRVADDRAALVGIGRDRLHGRAVGHLAGEVHGLPVDASGHDLAADRTDGLQGLAGGGAAGQLGGRSVGALDGDDGLPGHGARIARPLRRQTAAAARSVCRRTGSEEVRPCRKL